MFMGLCAFISQIETEQGLYACDLWASGLIVVILDFGHSHSILQEMK